MNWRCLFVISAVLSLTGCASVKGQASVKWPWADGEGKFTAPCATTCQAPQAMEAYLRATQFCRDVAIFYENGGRASGFSQFAVGTVGILAGSVAAPLAQGTAAKAWSGLSGATNALQIPMEQTFSASLATSRQNAVVQAAANGAKAFVPEQMRTTKSWPQSIWP